MLFLILKHNSCHIFVHRMIFKCNNPGCNHATAAHFWVAYLSVDWFKGKSTGKHSFLSQIWWFLLVCWPGYTIFCLLGSLPKGTIATPFTRHPHLFHLKVQHVFLIFSSSFHVFPCLFHVFSMFSWTCFHVFSMCFPCVFPCFCHIFRAILLQKHPQGLAELTLQPAALAGLPARSPRPRSTRRPGLTNWGRSSKKGPSWWCQLCEKLTVIIWYRTKFDTIWIYISIIWIFGVYV